MKQITTFILLLALCVCTDVRLYGCGSPAERQADGAGERDGTAGHSR